jgi:hypothetical protein
MINKYPTILQFRPRSLNEIYCISINLFGDAIEKSASLDLPVQILRIGQDMMLE